MERKLSDSDIEAIVDALAEHSACRMGLTPDEVTTLKRFLGVFNKAASLVGALILTSIVAALIAIFAKGFWGWLAIGTKAASTGGK